MRRFLPVSVVLVLALLAGCTTLPRPQAPGDKRLALIFDRGTEKTGYYKLVDFTVTIEGQADPVVLKDGVNFLAVPPGQARVTLLSFAARGQVAFAPATMFEVPINTTVEVPEGSIVLCPVALGYRGILHEGTFRGEPTVKPVDPRRAAGLVDAWKHHENAASWATLDIATRE